LTQERETTERKLGELFRERFGGVPHTIVRSPGRVNLIGEHTDYNDGLVFPMAIDRSVWIGLTPTSDRSVVVVSADFAETTEFSLDGLGDPPGAGGSWVEYLKGVAWALQRAGYELTGWQGVLAGDVPIGAGLASSAALEVATARAFAEAAGTRWDPLIMARIAQSAEREWIGVECGIMDQLISACGVAEHALMIDCRSLEMRPVPLPPKTVVLVLDTTVSRSLAGSAYNTRREECAEAARLLGARTLRDVDTETSPTSGEPLPDPLLRRVRHVISENARVLEAAEAMRAGDPARLGEILNAGHASLRDDYEVSCRELDLITECARKQQGCFGARMTGAGFGGCAIALVDEPRAQAIADAVTRGYTAETGETPRIWACRPSSGADVVRSV